MPEPARGNSVWYDIRKKLYEMLGIHTAATGGPIQEHNDEINKAHQEMDSAEPTPNPTPEQTSMAPDSARLKRKGNMFSAKVRRRATDYSNVG